MLFVLGTGTADLGLLEEDYFQKDKIYGSKMNQSNVLQLYFFNNHLGSVTFLNFQRKT